MTLISLSLLICKVEEAIFTLYPGIGQRGKFLKNLHIVTYLGSDLWNRRDLGNCLFHWFLRLFFSGPWEPWVGHCGEWWEIDPKVLPLYPSPHIPPPFPSLSALLSFIFHIKILRDFVGEKCFLLKEFWNQRFESLSFILLTKGLVTRDV